MVGKTGFEPATLRSQTECSTKLSHFPRTTLIKMPDFNKTGAPGGTRTPNLLIRSQTIYPIDLRAQVQLFYQRHIKLYQIDKKNKVQKSFLVATNFQIK